MRLDGASTLVTGGASGLGLATARELARRGAQVVIVDLPSARGEEAAKDLGAVVSFAPADILDDAAFGKALDLAEQYGPLRAVVHCAGRGGDRLRILDDAGNAGDFESFREVVRVNLFGTYNVLRLSAARMAANETVDGDRGAIILTASTAAFEGQIGQTSYTASKVAVHGLTLVAARDLASSQIRVNTIAPSSFDTPLLAQIPDDIRDALVAAVPHPKRLGLPEDFAHLAAAILENPYMNGETVRIDGGFRRTGAT